MYKDKCYEHSCHTTLAITSYKCESRHEDGVGDATDDHNLPLLNPGLTCPFTVRVPILSSDRAVCGVPTWALLLTASRTTS